MGRIDAVFFLYWRRVAEGWHRGGNECSDAFFCRRGSERIFADGVARGVTLGRLGVEGLEYVFEIRLS